MLTQALKRMYGAPLGAYAHPPMPGVMVGLPGMMSGMGMGVPPQGMGTGMGMTAAFMEEQARNLRLKHEQLKAKKMSLQIQAERKRAVALSMVQQNLPDSSRSHSMISTTLLQIPQSVYKRNSQLAASGSEKGASTPTLHTSKADHKIDTVDNSEEDLMASLPHDKTDSAVDELLRELLPQESEEAKKDKAEDAKFEAGSLVVVDLSDLQLTLSDVLEANSNDDTSKVVEEILQAGAKKEEQNWLAKRLEALKEREKTMITKQLRTRFLGQGRIPRAEEVLRGKALFKALAFGVRGLYAAPLVITRRRRLATCAHEKIEDKKALGLLFEQTIFWLSKNVKIPLHSIQHDTSLDFDAGLKHSSVLANSMSIPFKVRVRSIIRGLCSEIPPLTLSRLLNLFITDGHYLPMHYFTDHELTLLEFDRYGATSNMMPIVLEATDDHNIMTVKDVPRDMSRISTLLASHFVLKVLIYNLIMSPWSFGICPAPSRVNLRRTISNFLHVASLVYVILQRVVPGLAIITKNKVSGLAKKQSKAANPIHVTEGKSWLVSVLERFVPTEQFADLEAKYGSFFSKDRPLYDSPRKILEYLHPEETYTFAGLENFITECATLLREWTQKCVVAVVNVDERAAEMERKNKEKVLRQANLSRNEVDGNRAARGARFNTEKRKKKTPVPRKMSVFYREPRKLSIFGKDNQAVSQTNYSNPSQVNNRTPNKRNTVQPVEDNEEG